VSDLIAIAYPDQAAVERARENLQKAVTDDLIQVEDVVVLIRDQEGKLEVRQGSSGVGMMALGGAMWGGLIGLVFLAPLFGMAAGALAGGAAWKGVVGDLGVDQGFVKELSENMPPGSAALILLVRTLDPDKVLPNIREPGHVIQTTLGDELEAQLDAALAAAKTK
jgi:uncharacterized membrane protein